MLIILVFFLICFVSFNLTQARILLENIAVKKIPASDWHVSQSIEHFHDWYLVEEDPLEALMSQLTGGTELYKKAI